MRNHIRAIRFAPVLALVLTALLTPAASAQEVIFVRCVSGPESGYGDDEWIDEQGSCQLDDAMGMPIFTLADEAELEPEPEPEAESSPETRSTLLARMTWTTRVRSGPGLDHEQVGVCWAGKRIKVMGAAPGTYWNEVLLGCSEPGWIHGGFEVLEQLAPPQAPDPAPAAMDDGMSGPTP